MDTVAFPAFERHRYPPMLGPLEAVPAGTPAWAERLGLRILHAIEHTGEFGVDKLMPWVTLALDADPQPWSIWPEDRPCLTPDRYFQYAAGTDCESIAKLVAAYYGENHSLVRRLRRSNAEGEAIIAEENKQAGINLRSDTTKVNDRGANYLLRRLARDRPDILAAYERGEYATPTAAARAAGIKVGPTPLEALHRAWRKATPDDRATFLAKVVG